jgi:hypothetical protein
MHRYVGPSFCLFAATTCVGLVCCADRGDPLKTSSADTGSSGSGGGDGSGGGSSSGSSDGSDSGGDSGSSSGSGSGSSGGSSSGSDSGSSSGSSDADAGVVETGPVIPEGGASCVTASCQLKVQYTTQKTNATNSIEPDVNLYTTPLGGANLANVKVHYYFMAQGCTTLKFECRYAGYPGGMTGFSCPSDGSPGSVFGTFVSMGADATANADTYLELSFTGGTLLASSAVSINFSIHDSNNYATIFPQTSDWSYFSYTGSTSYVDAPYITAYLNGRLAWGIEPGPLPEAGPSDDASSDASDASATTDASDASSASDVLDASTDALGPSDARDGG